MTDGLDIYPIGTQVVLQGDTKAIIFAVTIGPQAHLYHLRWMEGGAVEEAALFEFEFEVQSDLPTQRIGFICEQYTRPPFYSVG